MTLKRVFYSFFIIMGFLYSVGVWGDVRVEAVISPTAIHPQDSFTLTVSVRHEGAGNIQSPRLPSLNNFYLMGEQVSQNVSITPNYTLREKKYHYTIRPKKEGLFQIGSVQVVVDGKVYKTEPLEIKVSSKTPSRPQKPSQPSPFGFPKNLLRPFLNPFFEQEDGFSHPLKDRDVLFKLERDKNRVYLGEMVMARWVVYIREDYMGNISSGIEEQARFDGFWVESLFQANGPPKVMKGVIEKQGIRYKKYLIADYALVPLRTGRLKIGSMKLNILTGGMSIFNFTGQGVFKRKSSQLPVQVSPLPKKGRGPFFTSAVGDFSISAHINKKVFSSQDSIIYKISVTGRGHPHRIRLPSLDFGPSLQVYNQVESQKFSLSRSKKEFEIILVPKTAGKITIPSFELSTFDPQLGIYKVHILPAISIQVNKQDVSVEEEKTQYFQPVKKNHTKQSEENKLVFAPWVPDEKQGLLSAKHRQIFWISVYGLLLVLLLIWLFQKRLFIRKKTYLEVMLKEYSQKVDKALDKGDTRKAGVILLDLVYAFLLELSLEEEGIGSKKQSSKRLSHQSHGLRNWNILLQQISPHLRIKYEDKINSILGQLEQLSFAPLEAVLWKNKKHTYQLKNHVFHVLKDITLDKAGFLKK